MIYTFKCIECGSRTEWHGPISMGPPGEIVICEWCGKDARRDWQADAPMIDTSGCKDHSEVRADKRVVSAWDRGSPEHIEQQFKRNVEGRRREIRDAGGQRGSIRQTHAVPAHLYHGKIAETGDRQYWQDPRNLNRHKECRVDDQ